MTVALDASLIETSIREFETTPPVKRASLTDLLSRIDFAIDILERNWSELPEELRSLIKLEVYQIAERKPRLRDRLWTYLFLIRFAMDRQVFARYFETATRLESALFDLIEHDDSRYDTRLAEAAGTHSTIARSAAGRQTKEEWSDWLRGL
jgi:hypothetical protein